MRGSRPSVGNGVPLGCESGGLGTGIGATADRDGGNALEIRLSRGIHVLQRRVRVPTRRRSVTQVAAEIRHDANNTRHMERKDTQSFTRAIQDEIGATKNAVCR